MDDVGLAGIFSERVFALASEAFWDELVAVEIVLVVAVGMHACHLGEYVLAYNGHVGCHGYATIALYQSADGIEVAFVDRGACVELIFQNGLHTGLGERCHTAPRGR